jgi:cytoskeletal protein CcmA (bactofilin family)
MSIDGLLSGQVGAKSGMYLKQKPSGTFAVQAELSGEVQFRDMVRVNGHIAGSVYSRVGTIIVDIEAQVDANVDVAVAVIGGTVRGDIIARERVELGPASRIYGNIWTRSIVIKDGAIFEGVCRMIEEQKTGTAGVPAC